MTARALPFACDGALRMLPGHSEDLPDPDAVRDYLAMADQAQAALARRQDSYPALVEAGKMTADDSAADIAAWTALAAEWRWICTGRGAPPPSFTLFDRIDAVDRAIDRVAQALSRTPRNAQLLRQRDLYHAMRWHLTRLRWGDPAVHFTASATHLARARLATCPTCEMHRGDPRVAACTRTDCTLPIGLPDERKCA